VFDLRLTIHSMQVSFVQCVGFAESILTLQISAPLHGACGFWSMIAVALFASEDLVQMSTGKEDVDYGLFLGGGVNCLGIQLLASFAVAAWTAAFSGATFFAMRRANILRVPADHEVIGLDVTNV
jgi:ammonium transporter, Amt family